MLLVAGRGYVIYSYQALNEHGGIAQLGERLLCKQEVTRRVQYTRCVTRAH